MPLIQSELIPRYGSDRLFAIGINSLKDTRLAAWLVKDSALTIPIALDLERIVYHSLKTPKAVFPLHVIVDPQGNIVHRDNGPKLDATREALDSLIGPLEN